MYIQRPNREYNCRCCNFGLSSSLPERTLTERTFENSTISSSLPERTFENSTISSLLPERPNENSSSLILSEKQIQVILKKQKHPDGEDGVHENHNCNICLNNRACILSTNCNHLCCCITCSKIIYEGPIEKRKCPICRGEWTNLLKIH
jgi:hypothetical protein